MNFSIPAAPLKKSMEATESDGYERKKKKDNNPMASRTNMSTPPTTPQSNRYTKTSPRRVQDLREQQYEQLPRQHTMPILQSSKSSVSSSTARVVSNLRRAHSSTTTSEAATAASATKDLHSLGSLLSSKATTAHPWKRQQQPQCPIGRKPTIKKDSSNNRHNYDKTAKGWTHDTWLDLSRYYEAVGRDTEETVKSFYRHESLQLCKDAEGFYDIEELWPKDVIRWRVLCLAVATKKHGGIPLLDRVQAYNEKKRRRRQQNGDDKKKGEQEQRVYKNEGEEEHPASKRRCRRRTMTASTK